MASPFDTGIVESFDFTTGDRRIDPFLVLEYKWGNGGGEGTAATVTYSFPPVGAHWDLSAYSRQYADNEPLTFTPFDTNQQAAARAALTLWSEVANISFVEIDESANLDNVGDIRFGNSGAVTNSDSAAWAWTPYDDGALNYPENGDIWFDYEYDPNLELQPGEFGFSTMIHEIGHAIGLDHPFADEAGEIALPAGQANQRYSIMAYNLYSGASPGFEAYGPMLYDILALQYMYGANMETGKGDNVYTFQPDKEYLECIWDAGGHDTIDLSNQIRNQVINLNAGTFSSIGVKNNGLTGNGNVAIAFNVTIEDAVGGSGNDKITGNDADNSLEGNGGNDTLVGGRGSDTLNGGFGVDLMIGGNEGDLYLVDNALDKVTEALNEGFDTIETTVSYSMAASANIEMLKLLGTGDLNGTGSATGNYLIGNSGNNKLSGGGGSDLLLGNDGNDWLDGGALEDTIYAGKGNDVVLGGSGAHDSIFGEEGDDVLNGGYGIDDILGGEGNDTLNGGADVDALYGDAGDDWLDGGAGNDVLYGGEGDDVYILNSKADGILDLGASLEDEIRVSTFSVDLSFYFGIDNVTLLGSAAINAFGNDSVNHLTGNNGANKLDGGIGADVLTGGKGSDIYVVDDAGDQVNEIIGGAAGGIDTVQSSFNFNLATLANVEKLTLTAGFGNLAGAGNDLNNTLTGNEGANTLNGGIGRDSMVGGAGDDHYFVDNLADVVTETILNGKGGGIDTVESSVTYSLAARANVDHLILTGSANSNGTGNALNNEITGNAGNNLLNGGTGNDTVTGGDGNDKMDGAAGNDVLDGGNANDMLIGGAGNDTVTGGDGNDKMTGGTGNDIFDFDLVSELGGLDIITDFKKGLDRIDIANLLDDALYAGSDIFADGIVAFTYDKTTTNIWFDADGTAGGGSASSLASLLNVNLTNADSASFIV
jgi:serralysin